MIYNHLELAYQYIFLCTPGINIYYSTLYPFFSIFPTYPLINIL